MQGMSRNYIGHHLNTFNLANYFQTLTTVTELYQSSPKYVQSCQQLLYLADNQLTIVTCIISSLRNLSYESIVDLFHFWQNLTNHVG